MIGLYGNPDLIKIDVEGYEFQALQGLTKKNNKLCFEWAEEVKESTIQCCNYLKVIGYKKFGYILGDEHLKEPEEWFDADKLIQKMNMQPSRKVEWGMVWAK